MKTIAVIGLGSIAKRHLANIKTLFPDARTIGVSASGRQPGEALANADVLYADINDAISEQPDMAIVASPATFHAPHATRFFDAGVPLIIEKPLTAEPQDAAALIEHAQKTNAVVNVGYCLRYLPSAGVVKQFLSDNKLGVVYNVFSSVGQFLPTWRKDKDYMSSVTASKALGGGVLLELSHELDYLQWLLGDLQLQYAQLRNSTELDLEVDEIADMVLTNAAGTVCNVHLDLLQKDTQRCCTIIGEKGRLEWNLLDNSVNLFDSEGKTSLYHQPDWDKNQMYLLMLQHFCDAVANNKPMFIPLSQAAKTVTLIEQIKNSNNWGIKQ